MDPNDDTGIYKVDYSKPVIDDTFQITILLDSNNSHFTLPYIFYTKIDAIKYMMVENPTIDEVDPNKFNNLIQSIEST